MIWVFSFLFGSCETRQPSSQDDIWLRKDFYPSYLSPIWALIVCPPLEVAVFSHFQQVLPFFICFPCPSSSPFLKWLTNHCSRSISYGYSCDRHSPYCNDCSLDSKAGTSYGTYRKLNNLIVRIILKWMPHPSTSRRWRRFTTGSMKLPLAAPRRV